MKRLVLALVLITLAASSVLSQEEPIPPKRSRSVRGGFFGAFTPSWLSMDVGPINGFLQQGQGAPLAKSGVFMTGGAGSAYIGVVPNLRVGGAGMSGSIGSTSVDASNLRRDAKVDVGFGGITLEYVVPAGDRLNVVAGALIGWGGIDITLRKSNGGNNTWQTEQAFLGSDIDTPPPYDVTRTYTSKFFVWVPSVSVEYVVLDWVGVRLGVSYVGMSAPSWQVDGKYDLLGVPSNVSGRGVMVNGAILFGFLH